MSVDPAVGVELFERSPFFLKTIRDRLWRKDELDEATAAQA